MTAEMFLAVFLATLLVGAIQWAFAITVYVPVKRWLANRAWERLGKSGDLTPLFPGSKCIEPSGCTRKRRPGSLFCDKHGPGCAPPMEPIQCIDTSAYPNTCSRSPVPGFLYCQEHLALLGEVPGARVTVLGARVTVTPARVYPVWLRRTGDRLHVLVEIFKGRWVVAIDVQWPGGDCEISHIWEGYTDHAPSDPLSTSASQTG